MAVAGARPAAAGAVAGAGARPAAAGAVAVAGARRSCRPPDSGIRKDQGRRM